MNDEKESTILKKKIATCKSLDMDDKEIKKELSSDYTRQDIINTLADPSTHSMTKREYRLFSEKIGYSKEQYYNELEIGRQGALQDRKWGDYIKAVEKKGALCGYDKPEEITNNNIQINIKGLDFNFSKIQEIISNDNKH